MPGDHSSTARDRIRHLLDHGHADDPRAFTDPLPEPFGRNPPAGWLWDGRHPHPGTLFGLRDERAYTSLADGELASFLHLPPSTALGTAPDAETALQPRFTELQTGYVRRSADVTMRGGTTSGVVYPLAVCEIARRFRLRNVGGASAGAVAAGFAAAAEVGRAGSMRPSTRSPLAPLPPTQAAVAPGRARAGFAGLADLAAWFTQADAPPGSADEFRMGQLFKPTTVARPLFRVIIAVMRARFAQLPVLVTGALGRWASITTLVLLLLAPLGATNWDDGWAGALRDYPLAAVWLVTLSLGVLGGVVLALLVRSRYRLRDDVPAELDEPVERPPDRPRPSIHLASLSFGAGVVLAAMLVAADTEASVDPWRLLLVWLALVLAVTGVQLAAVWRLIARARQQRFGIVSGANPTVPRPDGAWSNLWDALAGVPRPTVTASLMDWMHTVLADLAGLPDGTVLRFGHLWFGAGFQPGCADVDPGVVGAAMSARDRLVNLELMTSELVHGVSLRFPLRPDDVRDADGRPRILLRRSDLEGPAGLVLPLPVIDALCAAPAQTARDVTSGEVFTDLHPLPMPWDLPVAFAVRLSMALPGLFQAVRLYRPEVSRPIRDNFGARITRDGTDLAYPPTGATPWVQELWMSDGGITSNFPIHLFDNPMPLWPTLGISLSRYPRGLAHQDIWLPTDAQVRTPVPSVLGRSLLSFAGAVFHTATSWRDTSQTFMPAFLSRVAWVRQRSDEGGNHLFMGRETISTLALRGMMAGARLSRRFAADGHWHRHQWLRLRVALGNVSALDARTAVSMADPFYQRVLADGWVEVQAVQTEMDGTADPNPAIAGNGVEVGLPWFEPQPGFWSDAGPTVAGLVDVPGADPDTELSQGVPTPAPDLRQVPPT